MKKPLGARAARFLYPGIFAGVVLAGALLLAGKIITEREVASSLLALFGTFLGALFAFRLNEHKEDLKTSRERRDKLNRALFVLARQTNAIVNVHLELQKHKEDFERAFNCPAVTPPPYKELLIDFDSLGFLLEEDPSLLMKLTIEQEGFHQAMESLRLRNEFYVNEVQREIVAKGLNRQLRTFGALRTELGERLTDGAINQARVMYRLIGEANESLPLVHEQLFALAKKLYPDAQFVRLSKREGNEI